MNLMTDQKNKPEIDLKEAYYLQNYLYQENGDLLKEAERELDISHWNNWHRAILIQSDVSFFDLADQDLWTKMERTLRRSFRCLGLNARQTLLLFQETYCDYSLIGRQVYIFLKQIFHFQL